MKPMNVPIGPYAFIPKRLEIPDRPELSEFPFNILIVERLNGIEAHVLYEPQLDGYESTDGVGCLTYVGKPQGRIFLLKPLEADKACFLEAVRDMRGEIKRSITVAYDAQSKLRVAYALKDDQNIGQAQGREWHRFFIHVAMIFQARRTP